MTTYNPWADTRWERFPPPRDLWLAGEWDYARGRPAQEHPDYGNACKLAEKAKWNGYWIRTYADVDAVVNHGCYFDEHAAWRVCEYFRRYVKVSKGAAAGGKIPLIDWQMYDFLGPLFGWKRANGHRRFSRGGLWVPKKQGKSTLVSGAVPFLMTKDGEAGPEIYTAAGDRQQSSIIFDETARMIRASSEIEKRMRIVDSRKAIYAPETNGSFRALSADAKLHEGINASTILFDELHVQRSRLLWDTLAGSQIARREPLFLSLSTAGLYDPLSIGWEEWNRGTRIRDGRELDPSFFSLCYQSDDSMDWHDPDVWRHANPSWGCTIYEDNLREIYKAAAYTSSKQGQFKRYHLNRWVRSTNRWMDVNKWEKIGDDYGEEDLNGCECFGGLDLGSTDDLTALCLWFPQDPARILNWFWLPEENVAAMEDRHNVPYGQWIADGLIQTTPGSRCNYTYIKDKVLELRQKYDLQEIRYDPYNASSLVTDLDNEGVTMTVFRQTPINISPPTKSLEICIAQAGLNHNRHPVLDWMMGNAQAHVDWNDNIKLVKSEKNNRYKIDGVIAMVMAFSGAEAATTSGYGLDEGIRFI
jgi:phage terminase large subunit-like protein